jgi:hypothetical protein
VPAPTGLSKASRPTGGLGWVRQTNESEPSSLATATAPPLSMTSAETGVAAVATVRETCGSRALLACCKPIGVRPGDSPAPDVVA